MSSEETKKTASFIPTLTEVIESDEKQLGLELPTDDIVRGVAKALKSEVRLNDTNDTVEKQDEALPAAIPQTSSLRGTVSVRIGTELKETDPQTISTQKSSWGGITRVSTSSFDEIEVAEKGMVNVQNRKASDNILDNYRVEPYFDDETQEDAMGAEDARYEEIEYGELLDEDVFSPLSRNPAAAEDSLRPSDLMLVALTERIAAKARNRVGKNLEEHIQTKIFPLLDDFVDQLIKHLEGDMLKMIKEGLAEATREELERLRKK